MEICFCFSSQTRYVSYTECSPEKDVKPSQDWAHCKKSENTWTDLDNNKALSGYLRGQEVLAVDSSSQETLTNMMRQLRIMDNHQNAFADRATSVQERLLNRRPLSSSLSTFSSSSSWVSWVIRNVSVRYKPTWWQLPHRRRRRNRRNRRNGYYRVGYYRGGHNRVTCYRGGYNRGRYTWSRQSFCLARKEVSWAVAGRRGPVTFRRRRPTFEKANWPLQFIQRTLVKCQLDEIMRAEIPYRMNCL